ncbi:MFS transporter [Kocuria coralli]|uniref:MFS transporter n=1 Tax=Kocuria coralli TaxID=1461025 RepID=A0A5J5KXT6_9MICC|nr:MFS transporter [Kocuria coralli]
MALTDPGAVDRALRSPQQRHHTFLSILVNTAVASLSTSYLWFACTFWIYLETRNVIATGAIGGAFMLLIALTSISFGTLVDRFRKLDVMRAATFFALIMFLIAGVVYLMAPDDELPRLDRPWFWAYALLILVGAVVENIRAIALATTVTILIDPDKRANANGLVGMVQGMAFIVTSVVAGLSIGLLGMGWTHLITVVLTAATLVHLLFLSMPEELRPAATDAHGGFDLKGSWRAVAAVSGLFALILFSTFNNFIGGVYMALMDPYGLELFAVEVWGVVFALGGTGFIVGGALIGKFGLGRNPLRTLLLAVLVMGVLGGLFTVREWAWLYVVGIWLYMMLVPAVEAAEQTVIQRVVPLERQGRVFGFAGAFEASAAPVTAFVIAPIAELWIIPWSRSADGASALSPLLGDGTSRGIALIFLGAGIVMVIAALVAFLTPVYRRISREYAVAAEEDEHAEKASAPGAAPGERPSPSSGDL